ncbi:MAG: hypothetical protein ACJ8OJ_20725 [Povalibacter sp.]
MTLNSKWALLMMLTATLSAAGCAEKKEATTDSPAASFVPAVEQAAASSGASSAATPAPAAAVDSAANDEKAAAIQAALAEDAIVSDPRGQWATSGTSSSTYASDKAATAKTSYAPNAATGAPDVERYGDNGNAWTTETPDKGIEWLEVKFDKPVAATQLRIRQNYGGGAIMKVELIDDAGMRHIVWQGIDQQAYAPSTISWFDRSFEKTAYKATGARITLATNAVLGWNEIDAVQLLGD